MVDFVELFVHGNKWFQKSYLYSADPLGIVIRGPMPSIKHDPNQVMCGVTPAILLLRMLRQEDQAVKVSLGYTAKTYLKETSP